MVTVSDGIGIRSDDHFRIIGNVNQTTALLTIKNQQLELHAFDRNLRLKSSVEVDIIRRNSRIIASTQGENSFFLFSQKRDGQDIDIYYWEFDENLKLIDSSSIVSASHLMGYSVFYATISDDFSKILFFRSDNNTNLQVVCYDIQEKEVIWTQNLQLEGNLRQDFRQMLVSNMGEMVLVLKQKERGFRRGGILYEFIHLHPDGKLNNQSIEMETRLPGSERFVIDHKNRKISGGGVYYERNAGRAEGQFTLFLKMDNSLSYTFNYHPFSVDILAAFSERNINRAAVIELQVQDIMLRQDGGVIIFSEINKTFERRPTYSQRGLSRTMGRSIWTDHHLEDVLISSFDGIGELDWFEVLYKKQISHDDGALFSSYFIVESPNFLRLIYNDEISGNSTVSEFLLAANGFSERKNVMNTEHQNVKLRFRNAYQISTNEIIIPSESSSRLRLLRIKY
ncbi:MAG: hypothetical protein EA362_12150 [Saprospirales bacterium]|nr:MAG: hypothetical protein EA362_12150 [Saprospirales bacterium]